jgi:hypothetical protein
MMMRFRGGGVGHKELPEVSRYLEHRSEVDLSKLPRYDANGEVIDDDTDSHENSEEEMVAADDTQADSDEEEDWVNEDLEEDDSMVESEYVEASSSDEGDDLLGELGFGRY